MIHEYPRVADSKMLMNVLAQQRGQPSTTELMAPSECDDARHDANWQAVVQLVETGRGDGFHASCPFGTTT